MGTKERRQKEKEVRRRHILSAAAAEFIEKGFEAATMPAIAAKTELSIGTLYLYFPCKEDLYATFLADGLRQLAEAMSAAAGGQDPVEDAQAMSLTMLRFLGEHPEYRPALIPDSLSAHNLKHHRIAEDQLAELESLRVVCKQTITAALDKGIKAGSLIGSDAQRLSDIVWALLIGVVVSLPADPTAAEVLRMAAVTVILRGLSSS
ncbi:MAG TPA: TetR/AcrR family transcriptional regulator [Candidatus Brocadiia bacterium]|nr:TetR/AcrR family transcriptional regulator [Candidatus Brocadiia bacterium]